MCNIFCTVTCKFNVQMDIIKELCLSLGLSKSFLSGLADLLGLSVDVNVCLNCKHSIGTGDQFCGQSCVIDYYRRVHRLKDQRICLFPGCIESCYVNPETNRTYDFCGQKHAREFRSLTCSCDNCSKRRVKKKACNQDGDGPVLFYDEKDPYYEFTNFFCGIPILLDGKKWKSSEHYFQAQKFVGTPYVEMIRCLGQPREAFEFSRKRDVASWQRKDWEEVKVQVMYKALLAKFSQHDELRDMLLKTGDRELVEHTSNDSFWGDGGGYSNGDNYLGRLLMMVRSQMQGGMAKDPSLEDKLGVNADLKVPLADQKLELTEVQKVSTC